jgi:hypothetical protein
LQARCPPGRSRKAANAYGRRRIGRTTPTEARSCFVGSAAARRDALDEPRRSHIHPVPGARDVARQHVLLGASLTIPSTGASGSADPYPATVDVSGFHGKVADLTLTLTGFAHEVPDDVDVLLVAPDGTKVQVFSDAGGSNAVSSVNLSLNANAATALPDSTALSSGVFAPANYDPSGDTFTAPAPAGPYQPSLTAFNGVDPNGTWSLYVVDDNADGSTTDVGSIDDWSLTISGALHALPTETEADRVAQAIIADPSTLTGASFDPTGQNAASTPNGFGDPLAPNTLFDNDTASLAGFPVAATGNHDFAILTTGDAGLADGTPQTLSSGSGTSNGGGSPTGRGDTAYDVTTLRLNVTVPAAANCLALDYRFLSEEFPEYVGSPYNDAFIAEVDTSTWTTSGSTVTAPNDFATHTGAEGVNVNGVGPVAVSAAEASDTTYDAATGLVTTKTPIAPGAHTIFLSIFDQGDPILDSAAFVDNLQFINESPDTCKPPAVAETAPPPPVTTPPVTTPPPPSNAITIGSKIVFKSGATVLSVTVPGPGVLSVAPTGTGARAADRRADAAKKKKPLVKSVRVNVKVAGVVKVTLKPTAAGKKVLKKKGKLTQKMSITFTPTGGTPNTKKKTITIKRKVKQKK